MVDDQEDEPPAEDEEESDGESVLALIRAMPGNIESRAAGFVGTRFIGGANFAHAGFEKHAHFHRAKFGETTFGGGVTLDQARALADFDTNWGSERHWPAGWTERPLAADEQTPRPYGRWPTPRGSQNEETS